MLRGAKTILLALFLASSLLAQKQAPRLQPTLIIRGLGQGTFKLDGTWQFHPGDDLRWKSPSFDDSAWEPIDVSSSWGSQNHPAYTGFAWYRRHIKVETVDGGNSTYALLIPPIDDAYQVYWNGVLIGSSGKLPPHPRWYYTSSQRTFVVPSVGTDTIAIRVWKSPLLFVDPGTLGGFKGEGLPLLGDADSIAAEVAAIDAHPAQQFLYDYTLMVLYGFVTLLSLLLWSRNRPAKLFLWLAIFTITPVALSILRGVFPVQIPISYAWGWALNQPLYALNHISLWFLLVWLLRLNSNRRLVRWTWALAIATFSAGVLDGALAFFWGSAGASMQVLDALLTTFILLVEIFPFVIIAIGHRKRLEGSRWFFAVSALISQMIDTIADASAAGQRFTHWTLFAIINTPLFTLNAVTFTAENLAAVVLFLSILYAVYRYSMEQQARQSVLEREMQSAREIQRVLIPDTLPSLDGFAVTSAYRPALEVGGDFFQIIREEAGSTIVVLGDVSGKGLKAAMNVSLIVGVLRSLADASVSPVQMLEKLNRCLCGRLQGGFVTAVILRLHRDGQVTFANAGHLPPILNQREIETDGCLPLGIIADATYEEGQILLHPGDQLSLYTDGIVEARNATGELYGFDRLHALFASRPSAQQATEAAVAFGQDDDITVLTLTRLAAWEQPSISVVTPFADPAAPILEPTV
jgi:hypothetical protein